MLAVRLGHSDRLLRDVPSMHVMSSPSAVLRQFVDAITGFIFPVDACLYCGSTGPSQQDHFPIPAELDGKETVRACLQCHNMKDRLSDAFAMDWMRSDEEICQQAEVTVEEAAFLFGRASLLPPAVQALIDDIRDFPPPIRVMIGRRIRAQLLGIAFSLRSQS